MVEFKYNISISACFRDNDITIVDISEIEIKDKIVLVTGGANGIGFAYAKEFLRHDAMVSLEMICN